MFVNNNLKFVYVSITKSGSRSVIRLLRDNYGCNNIGHPKIVIPKQYEDYYSFLVVRNPYERMVSWWWAICKDKGDRYRHKAQLRKAGLTESLFDFLTFWSTGSFGQATHLTSNKKIDKIIKLENIQEEFNTLPFVKTPLAIPRINTHTRPSWEELLDVESGKLINRVYEDDFKCFGYEQLVF